MLGAGKKLRTTPPPTSQIQMSSRDRRQLAVGKDIPSREDIKRILGAAPEGRARAQSHSTRSSQMRETRGRIRKNKSNKSRTASLPSGLYGARRFPRILRPGPPLRRGGPAVCFEFARLVCAPLRAAFVGRTLDDCSDDL